jgi:hypothetical protein
VAVPRAAADGAPGGAPAGGVDGWAPVLPADRREAALAVAWSVASRVIDQVAASGAADEAAPFAVAGGEAGLAMLCAYCDECTPGERWDVAGHGFLSTAARAAERGRAMPPGLFDGLAGLTFAASLLGRDGTRYHSLLSTLDAALAPVASMVAERVAGARDGLAVGDFDVISGAAGIGAYLLARRGNGDLLRALVRVLDAVVGLAGSEPGPAGDVPRWWTPPELLAGHGTPRDFPAGNLNCGMSHGIPGPLALLALALREGVEVDGQADAISGLSGWLAEHRADDEWGVNWPSVVPLTRGSERIVLTPARTAWCYGAPGVARSLWLAGTALGDTELQALAVEAMEAVYRRPPSARRIDAPTFCHGVAGLLQITLRFAQDTGLALFPEQAVALADQLLSSYDERHPFGFAAIDPDGSSVDRPGVLDGAAGVAMVLLAACTDAEPRWDRCFLLA